MVSVVYIRRLCDEEQSILILIKGCKHKTGAYNQGSMVGIQLEMTVGTYTSFNKTREF